MATPGQPQAGAVKDLESGEVLDSAWRLEELVGQGGMGRVFRATDLKLGRIAAVKALSAVNLEAETVKRFEREAQMMAKLRHRGIVTLYSVGRTRGVPWLAMQYLEGRSLWKVLAEHHGQLPPEVLLPIARQLLVTLAYIHGNKLIHRDLKPSNIHVSAQGQATLLDLGLARGHKSTLTRTGVVWGTPDYMAPEQILGERELDGRADLYALSVVLYRMLSGKAPFGDGSDDDDHGLMRAHLTRPRPDISRLVPGLSMLLGAVLQKGLAIHPEDRFQSAEEMLTALERAMAARPRDAPTTVRPRPATPGTEPHAALGDAQDLPTPGEGVPAQTVVARPSRPDSKTVPLADAIKGLADEDEGADSARTQRAGFTPLGPDAHSTLVSGLAPITAAPRPSSPTGVTPVEPAPVVPAMTIDEEAVDSGPTDPLAAEEGPSGAALIDEGTRPSKPLRTVSRPQLRVVQAPLPAYLTPPWLLGAAVLLLVLGVVLGKLL